jgi:primosomal protein N' (replication factor Y)
MAFVIKIAVLPIPGEWSYQSPSPIAVGERVLIPFGKNAHTRMGIVLDCQVRGSGQASLKPILSRCDNGPVWDPATWAMIQFASTYYFTPVSTVLLAALPAHFRDVEQPEPVGPVTETFYQIASGLKLGGILGQLGRARKQKAAAEALSQGPLNKDALEIQQVSRSAVKELVDKRLVDQVERAIGLNGEGWAVNESQFMKLEPQQLNALAALRSTEGFGVSLLNGITGSGKSEVFYGKVADVVKQGKQALILCPEIGLTPQMLERVARKFQCPTVCFHSGMSDKERANAFRMARSGQAGVIVGTRSAVWMPLPRLGVIVVDEEHDGSFKQQGGFSYHARDVAIYRAMKAGVPVILASATPSMESMNNARCGKYQLVSMPERAGGAQLPSVNLLPIGGQHLSAGLCGTAIEKIREKLREKSQVLVYIGRRGWAPIVQCESCGFCRTCSGCNRPMTYHLHTGRMHCHVCSTSAKMISLCPQCGCDQISTRGMGTQQVTSELQRIFPTARIMRMDSDSMGRKNAMTDATEQIHNGSVDIIVATQIASKGHDFHGLTLMIALEIDSFLYSDDIVSEVELSQLLIQVAGRVGRGSKPGEVFVQTYLPEHPLLKLIAQNDYTKLADVLLKRREELGTPPFTRCVHVEVADFREAAATHSLYQFKSLLENKDAIVFGEIGPTPLKMKKGKHFMRLPVYSNSRKKLHEELAKVIEGFRKSLPRDKEFMLNIDPM